MKRAICKFEQGKNLSFIVLKNLPVARLEDVHMLLVFVILYASRLNLDDGYILTP